MWAVTSYGAPSGDVGVSGAFWIVDELGNKKQLTIPNSVDFLSSRPSFAKWTRGGQSRIYISGSHTDNLVLTEHLTLARLGIFPISSPLVVTGAPIENQIGIAKSGTGTTGEAVVYLRWRDRLNGRRSPLSGGVSISLANEGLAFSNVPTGPTPSDPGVDKIEVWISLDGQVPRHLATRDVGATSFTCNEDVPGEQRLTR